MTTYMITEPYDGSHVRVLASARSPEAAERQMDRVRHARKTQRAGFFGPIRRVIGDRRAVENEMDQRIAELPTWGDTDW